MQEEALDPALVEAVARALCEAQGLIWEDQNDFRTSGNGDDDGQEFYRDQARAAIRATLSHLSPTIPVVRFKDPSSPS